MMFRIFRRAAALAGCVLGLAVPQAHADDGAAPAPSTASAASAFASRPAAPDPGAPDPQRWLPLMGANGVISYFDQSAVRRQGTEVGVVVMRNAPSGVIRTASGDPIRSSLKRMVLNCATSMFAVVEQTLYSKRFARGDSLYTIRAPQYGTFQAAGPGTIAGELLRKLCR
ncbi:surface-adhesin E family protein [Cupriavidus sp. TMH.W2]|uniref:surface-adhesin E family protein n=1 Tax=Cupriavidus sp. TMH.W2 TaxID=3434465 RepID=UPI003D772FAD